MKRLSVFFAILLVISLFAGVAAAAAVTIIFHRSNVVGPLLIDPVVSVSLVSNLTANVHYPFETIGNFTATLYSVNPGVNVTGVNVEFRNQYDAPLAIIPTNSQGVANALIILQSGNWSIYAQPVP